MKAQRLNGFVKAILLATALIMAIGFFSSNALASNDSGQANFHYVTVNAGQTLWGLAESHAKNSDPRDWIAAVVDLNNLTTNQLQPGQRLALPN
jgi:LysM repeat protein